MAGLVVVNWRRLGVFMIGLVIASVLILALLSLLWNPDLVSWVNAAYPLAYADIWKGPRNWGTKALFHFIHSYGRTVVTVLLAGAWLAAFWRMVFVCFAWNKEKVSQ